jgi:anaerobic selenocysteine-containing dehydrogenase
MPTTEHLRTCPLCEAMCGLRIHVEDGRVTRIRPNDDDVWSRGYICPKGTTLGELHHDPDRLRAPMVRRDGAFVEVSWAEAFAECERLLHGVVTRHGKAALTYYVGNPTVHNFSLSRYVAAFGPLAGIERLYSAGTIDQWPKNVVCALLYGGMWAIPTADIDRTDHLVIMGANPHASQGSLMACPDFVGRLTALRARGGKSVVIDPRRTGTAERADEWVAIRPGTDAALLMAWVNVLFADGLVRPGRLADFTDGIDAIRALCEPFTPEVVADVCAIPADTIRRLIRELAAAPRASIYGRIGTCNQEFGTLASWLVEVVNVLTGNLDRPGGSMFANPVEWSFLTMRPPEFADGWTFGRWASRVRGAPEVLGQVPISCLAEEIAVPGAGQIRALITFAGNPVVSAADAGRLDDALPELECMICVDNWLNETTRHAHVVLPGLSALEQPHYDELIWSWAVRDAAIFSEPVFPPPARPAEWEIMLALAAIAQGQAAADVDVTMLDQMFFVGLVGAVTADPTSRIAGRDAADIVAATPGSGPERLLDFGLRLGPWGEGYGARTDGMTLARLREHPNGIDMGAHEPRLPNMLTTPSQRIDLVPAHITADVPRLRRRLERSDDGLLLVSRRHLRSNNSWMHNVPSLMTGRDRCTLLVHPDDAGRLGLADGGRATVRSAAGEVEAPVEVSDEMMPGVVCLPHGWGHDRPGTRLGVASRHAGVNNNLLAPGDLVDVPSGNAAVNGIPVQVLPA